MPMNLQVAFEENLRIALMLALCALVGIIAARLYDHSHKNTN
jgi:hypothetical protein